MVGREVDADSMILLCRSIILILRRRPGVEELI
jgi:hypothetical protein